MNGHAAWESMEDKELFPLCTNPLDPEFNRCAQTSYGRVTMFRVSVLWPEGSKWSPPH